MTQSTLISGFALAGAHVARRFLGWDGGALAAAAALLADHYARGAELRMDGATLVLPGARAGRRLKELLLEEAERRGLRLVPPQVTTVGTLPELCYAPARPFASSALGRWAWVRALRGLQPEQLALLLAAPPAEDDLRGWARLARTVAELHHEVSGAGKRFAQVLDCCAEGLLFDDTERWTVLAAAERTYAAELERLGFADRGIARIAALEEGMLALEREVWVVGVAEMPGVLRRMLTALVAGRLHVLVQAPESEAEAFDELGCLRPEAWSARAVPLSDEQIAVCGRPSEQAAEVVQTLASLGGRYAAEEIVVAVPDEELVPYLERQLATAGVPVRAAGGTEAERSAPARLLAACADYLDGRRYEAMAALARHPDLWRWLRECAGEGAGKGASELAQEDGWLEPLDGYFGEHLPASFAGMFPDSEDFEDREDRNARDAAVVAALGRALDDERFLGRLAGRRALSAWMRELLALVVEVYGRSALERANPADRRLLDACAALRAAALVLHELPGELAEECDAATAIRLLLDELAGAALAPEPDPSAVELLGWLELRLDDAPVAVVTGFNEPFLPESLNAHAFLPNALRERLGLVCNARRYARDAYELTALLCSREQVRIIAGRRSAAGDPLRPSRLMFAVEGRAMAERVRRFFAEESAVRPAPTTAAAAPPAGESAPRGFRLPPEPVIHASVPLVTLPVTAFRHLLADPYGYALEKLLGLSSLDDAPRELDGLRFGGLAHAVLERFARTPEVGSDREGEIRARLDATLDAAVRERFGAHALPAVRIQTEQLRARLHAFARWHAAWVAEGWRVMGVECFTPPEGVPFEVDGEVFHITGRIDRIDYHAERGEWALFDYKTGDRVKDPDQTHRAGKGEERYWTDLQLPLYRHLLPHVRDAAGRHPFAEGAPAGEIRLGYVVLPREVEQTGALVAGWDAALLADADRCAQDVVRLVRRNHYEFDPARAAAYRDSPLAPVLGIGYLESALAATEEGEA